MVARYGGEEFALILPGCERPRHDLLERFRRGGGGKAIQLPSRSKPVSVTVSIGVAIWPEDGDSPPRSSIRRQRLYQAKARGRDQVVGPSPGRPHRVRTGEVQRPETPGENAGKRVPRYARDDTSGLPVARHDHQQPTANPIQCAPTYNEVDCMAEFPGIERETLDVDVVIVGAGPAGLAAAYQLAELIEAHNESAAEKKLEGLSIAVLEKGKEIGSHGISGAVHGSARHRRADARLARAGCPVESPVTDDAFWYLTEKMQARGADPPAAAAEPRQLRHLPRRIVQWMAPKVGEMGVDIFPEFPAVARPGRERPRGRRAHRRQGDRQERQAEGELRAGRRHPRPGHGARRRARAAR